ncbi:MAG: hypothetical protein RLZZ126_318 [Pseudomonadota bacterium]|jgi:predicted Zn-dependent protease
MSCRQTSHRGRSLYLAGGCLLLSLCGIATPQARSQDSGQQLLQQLLRQGPAGTPAQPLPAQRTPLAPSAQAQSAQHGSGNLLQLLMNPNAPLPSAQPAPTATTPPPGQTTNLFQLLSQSMDNIDEPKEIEIGRQLSAVLLGSKPLLSDMIIQRYVNRLGRWISLHSSRPDLPWTFAVLNDPGFNAFAAPGGYVFVTKGLLDRVSDESELAGILAHEINHITEKHHLKAIRKNAQTGLFTQLLASRLAQSVGAGLSQQILSVGRDIYSKGLDRDDEFEADRQGVALAARAGFDPYGLPAVLHQLRMVTPDDGAFTLTMSTHPAPQLRLDQLETAMGKRLDAFSGRPVVPLAQRLGR